MDELKQFQARLKYASYKDFSQLFEFISRIQNSKSFGEMKGGKEISDGVYIGHYVVPESLVSKFVEVCYQLDIIIPFDWMKWQEGKELIRLKESNFEKLDALTLFKLITLIIRNDRFENGFLVNCFEMGIILEILECIENKLKLKSNE